MEPGTATCKVLTTYADSNGKVYVVPGEYSQWFATEGTVMINGTSTRLTDYSPSSFTAMGQVTDKNGNPVEGARVMLIDDNNKEAATARSEASGNFEFANLVPTTKNFTVQVLFINGSQSFKAASSHTYPQTGTIIIDRADTKLNDYSPSAVIPQTTAVTTPVITAVPEKPANSNALAIALLIGVLLLAGIYLLLRKE